MSLQSVTIPWGVAFPTVAHFVGNFDVTKVVGVQVYVYGNGAGAYSGWTSVADPLTPAVSMAVNSFGRDAASRLAFNVNAIADGVEGAGRLCEQSGYQYYCDFTLVAQLESGASVTLQTMTIPWGSSAPFAHDFSGTVDIAKVVALEVTLSGYGGATNTGWTSVADSIAPAVSMTVVSTGRDASSNLTFDVSAVADQAQGSGRLCEQSGYQYYCDFGLFAQLVSGATELLQTVTIPWGSDSSFSHEFNGSVSSTQVVAVEVRVTGYGGSANTGWTPITDPLVDRSESGSVSVSVTSIGRDPSTDKLTYDLWGSMSGPTAATSPCLGANCSLYFQAMTSSGDVRTLGSISVPAQASFSGEFSGSMSLPEIVKVRTYTFPANAPHTYSSWVDVTDPYPARSITEGPSSVSRDPSTGKLVYDVAASLSGAYLPDGPCGRTSVCSLYLQTKSASGDVKTVTSVTIPNQATFVTDFTGIVASTQVVAVRVYANPNYGLPITYSDWSTVSDPYPTRSVALDSVSVGRDASTGNLVYDVSASVQGGPLPDGPCFGGTTNCSLHLQAKSVNGDVFTWSSVAVPAQASFSNDFKSSLASAPKIVAVRVYTSTSRTNQNTYGDWYTVNDQDKSESTGGGNKAKKGCTCKNGDPVNTQTGEFYETGTDLGIPGVGPAVDVERTYSSLNASVNGPFGYGTTSSFNTGLMIDTPGDSTDPLPRQVHIVQEDGATVQFTESVTGSYPASPWVLATLTHSTSTGNWTFTRDKQQVFVFDSSGKLISISDLHGNTVTYGYTSGHVTTINGSGGREVDLTWTSGRVSAIADSAGRGVAYGYDSAGNLTVVDAADNGLWGYTYDSTHRVLTETKPGGGVTTNVYNGTGQVTSQTDPVGRVTTFAYSGLTTTVTLPDGSVTTYTFNQGQPASITTATGTALAATTSYAYDSTGNLASQTDALGRVTTYTYDSAGNALTSTDPLGKVTTRTYDSLRDVTSVEDPLGRTTTMSYDSYGDLTSSETAGGNTTTLAYNTDGTVASSTDARGKTTSYTYDSAGRALCVTDPDSRQNCQSNDARGLATTKTNAAGKVTTMTFDDAGRLLTTTDPNSHTTTYVYDGDGNLTSTQDASGHTVTSTYDHADQRASSTDGRGKTTTYTYTPRGSLATITDPNGHVTTNAYDAQNQLTSVTDPDSHVMSFTYDLAGHKLSTTMPSTAVTTSTYDADGRVATTTDALGKVTAYAYDDAGELHSTTDPLSRVTTYSYTDDGKLHVTTLPDSSTETYAYNADDMQTSFTNADGDVTTYSYDDAGLLSSETQPGGMTTSYAYDAAGRIHNVTTPDGVVATRSYDDAGRLTGVNYSGSADDVSYTYFANGSRRTMNDGTGTTTYAYNANAALTSVQNGDGQSIGYGYDDASQLTSITYPGSKTVSYGYDNAGNMTSVTDWASRRTTLTVTADGLQNTRTDPSGVTETRSYTAKDQLTDISTATSSATLSDYGYGYDNAGQLTSSSLTDAIHTTTATNTWGYTNLGQLSSSGPSTGYTTTPAGELTATPAGDAFTYSSKQELASATNSSAGTTTAYSYNDNGSRIATATTTSGVTATVSYDYDARGNLTSVTTAGTTVSYQSDGDGLRQSRTVGSATSQFLWDPNHAIPLLLDDGTNSYIYATSTTPIAQVDDAAGTIEYLHADNVGSVRTITSASGTVVGATDFNAYGLVTSHTGTSNSNFGYATAWTDSTTELDYLRAREYDPATAQFLQVDPAIDQTRQPYGYVAGDPLSSDDPTGLCKGMDGTLQDRACTQNDFFWAGLGPSVYQSLCGSNDGWTCAVQHLDPVYAVLEGYGNEIKDSEAGCSVWQIAGDGAEGVLGLAGTAAVGAGGAGSALSSLTRAASLSKFATTSVDSSFDIISSGGRGGGNVKSFIGPPNSVFRGPIEGRVYQTNGYGQVINDITSVRVKPVTPNQGFKAGSGRKLVPTSEQLGWINQLWK